MEHATIEQRVHHLVETLPVGTRTLLVIDGKQKEFLRGYDEGNESSFKQATERLLDEGWVDELLMPPGEKELKRIHVNWFCFTPDDLKFWEHKALENDGTKTGIWTHDKGGVQVR
jgi:hypothetical protein